MSKCMPFAAWMCVLLGAATLPAQAQEAPAIASAESSAPAPAAALQGQALVAADRKSVV